MKKNEKSALLVGASGLVGNELLNILLSAKEYSKVLVFVRQSLGIQHPKLKEMIIDFDQLESYRKDFQVQDVFCCLGTTIKKAKTQDAFKKVDVDYPLRLGELSKDMQVEKFLIISSMGADPNSKVFYSRMKGLVESELTKLQLNSLHIFRPSLLLGNRREFRLGERLGAFIAKGLFFIFTGPFLKYKPIEGKKVALAMYRVAQSKTQGIKIYPSKEIERLLHKGS